MAIGQVKKLKRVKIESEFDKADKLGLRSVGALQWKNASRNLVRGLLREDGPVSRGA
ncbi:MAG: hypothetical protein H6936_05235 [Burkholderiales bacterium]|nr:hypothetical protein [Burkholderiales bacterium]